MRGIIKLMALISAAGTLAVPNLLAQPGPDHHGAMGTNHMQMRKEMMQEHQKMMEQMKAMDAVLDKDVAKMNQAQGSAKTDAMQTVINDLVKEHNVMREHMTEMHQRMMSHMQKRNEMMGGAEEGTGGSSTSPSQP